MSQPMPPPGYTPQYAFWPHYMTPPEELLAPARYAGILLIVFGVLMLIVSGCGGASVHLATETQFEEILRQQPQHAAANPQLTPQLLRTVATVMFIVGVMLAIGSIILGIIVRSGSFAATLIAAIYVAVIAIPLFLMLLSTLVSGIAAFAMSLLLLGIPLLMLTATMMLLIKAMRSASAVDAARKQLQHAHYQQQMASYRDYYEQHNPWPQPPASPNADQSDSERLPK